MKNYTDERKSYREGVAMLAKVIVGMIELDNIRKADIYQFCKDIIKLHESEEYPLGRNDYQE